MTKKTSMYAQATALSRNPTAPVEAKGPVGDVSPADEEVGEEVGEERAAGEEDEASDKGRQTHLP
jgi:hypothetical protein